MFSGSEFTEALETLGVTHVVWLPDSALGEWESALEQAAGLTLVRVCRESEAWAIAAGLHLGGKSPLVVIQNTGLFDSGDALRNVLFDLGIPLYAVIGYRSYLIPDSPDTAKHFTEPVLKAWGIDYVLIDAPGRAEQFISHVLACRAAGKPGAALIAEGRM
jgi:sulfopyruvate decarboxylase TPP-binding subunit